MPSDSLPLVSFLIPAYNHEDYIQGAVRSVLAQSYSNIELLVIDDGSPDSTWEKLLELKDECSRRLTNVIFTTQKNQGTCVTLNALLTAAKGEYCFILASDDLVKAEATETLLGFLTQNPQYVMAVGDNDIIDSSGTRVFWDAERNPIYDADIAAYQTFGNFLQKSNPHVNFYSEQFGSYAALIRGNHIPNGYLIKKSALDQIGEFTKQAPLEDYFMNLQLAKLGKIKYINKILYSYRWHSANTIKQTEKINLYNKMTIEHEGKLIAAAGSKEHKNAFLCSHAEKKRILKLGSFCKIYKTNSDNILIKLFGRTRVLF